MGIQFGQSVFEGCKAFWDGKREVYIFRLKDHYERFVVSCNRLCMPAPPRDVFFEAVELLAGEKMSWTSPFTSDVLYIRPILYGEDFHVMPLPSSRSTLVVVTAPLRLFATKPLSLFAERNYSRAARGGLGYAKTAANYAHQYLPTQRAKEAGCDAVLWLDADTHSFIEEASTMNIFLLMEGKLVTPELGDTILAGITRRSVIQLAKERLELEVTERPISLEEVAETAERGVLTELFTSSTALGVRPVARIVDTERTIVFPEERPLMQRLQQDLLAVQRGEGPDPWGWRHTVAVAGKGAPEAAI
jgi:branched-chain amino acid aminotransferase